MNLLRATKISTKLGTFLIVLSAIPLVAYTFHFHSESAKLHNGVETSPQFVAHASVK